MLEHPLILPLIDTVVSHSLSVYVCYMLSPSLCAYML